MENIIIVKNLMSGLLRNYDIYDEDFENLTLIEILEILSVRCDKLYRV